MALIEITLALYPQGVAALQASTASVGDALLAARRAGEGVAEEILGRLERLGFGPLIAGDDLGDLIRLEPVDGAAGGACKVHGLQILPSDRYIEFVSAIAGDAHAHAIGIFHGWPVLSVGDDTPTVAGGAGGSIPCAGGPPAP